MSQRKKSYEISGCKVDEIKLTPRIFEAPGKLMFLKSALILMHLQTALK